MFIFSDLNVNQSPFSVPKNIDHQEYLSLKQAAEKQLEGKNQVSRELLGAIMQNTSVSDFSITCKDAVSIPVHTAVLFTFWPFFEKMWSNDCVEKTNRTLHLDFPSSWVKPLVAFVYKQKLSMTWEEATGVLTLANMYLLPGLEDVASQQIKSMVDTPISLEDLFTGWERSVEACNDELRLFFGGVFPQMHLRDDTDLFKDWEQKKVLALLLDISDSVSEGMRREKIAMAVE
ncbi:hypothetical protein CJU90_0712 [Yarrowia sp. C11]|nr:hypothetical protein CKK34_2124 [Yarrowia sp. E02]KAG5373045.1 hypothetical protein CJU90_0712 [Yarrowia sp. C11]